MSAPRSLLRVRGYIALLANRLISSVILWLDFTLIFASLSYRWHATPETIGIASALYGLPGLILGPWFGRIADSHDPRRVLIASYAARGLTSASLFLAPNASIFVLLVFAKGISNLGAMPAEQILVRTMLTREQLFSNAGAMTVIDQLTKISAPLLGACLGILRGQQAGFALSALLAVGGTACLSAMRSPQATPQQIPATQTTALSLKALTQMLFAQADLRATFIASIVQTAVLGLYDPLLALFLRDRGFLAATFGSIVSCTAFGAIIGAAVFKRLNLRVPARRLACWPLIVFGATVAVPGLLAALGLPMRPQLLFALWIANGCAYGLTAMSFSVTLQNTCPIEKLGTVASTARSAQLAMLVIGPLAGSTAARYVGIDYVFLLSGTMAVFVGLAGVVRGVIAARRAPLPTHPAPPDKPGLNTTIAPARSPNCRSRRHQTRDARLW